MLSYWSHAKIILRIYEASICQKVKNTEAETKKHYSYKKSVYHCIRFVLKCSN